MQTANVMRQGEVERIIQTVSNNQCPAVVGLSNMGKTTLMRSLCLPEVKDRCHRLTGHDTVFVYVDCNRMVETSSQGFYELVVRSLQEEFQGNSSDLPQRLSEHYQRIVYADTQFLVPLSFNQALTDSIERDHRRLVLMFDEFDEAVDSLDGRVFLNLRSLKDHYPQHLVYITATSRRMETRRHDEQVAEFIEMFSMNTVVLQPFSRPEADLLASELAQQAGVTQALSPIEIDFLWRMAGGHPRLLRTAVSLLVELCHYTSLGPPSAEDIGVVEEGLGIDPTIRSECARLWGQLSSQEREILIQVATGTARVNSTRPLRETMQWGLIRPRLQDDDYVVFCDLFQAFVQQQATVQNSVPSGIWIDRDAGDVWIAGEPIAPLTELEFRLLCLLHERLDKLTDKFQIVETVWGVNYLDEVDDARIEKLVSRLRAKVEPDPSTPRYIVTVRGRGYKLTSAPLE